MIQFPNINGKPKRLLGPKYSSESWIGASIMNPDKSLYIMIPPCFLRNILNIPSLHFQVAKYHCNCQKEMRDLALVYPDTVTGSSQKTIRGTTFDPRPCLAIRLARGPELHTCRRGPRAMSFRCKI